MVEIGAVQGRFQGLHIGHMEFLLEAKKRCRFLIIGVTNYDIHSEYISDTAEMNRFRSQANPFTFFERMMMIEHSMAEAGVPREEFIIVPFPIEKPQNIPNFVPDETVFFQTIYDEWGRKKVETLKKMGYQVQVMWERTDAERQASGTQVRQLMQQNGDWKSLMPPAAARYVSEHHLNERLTGQQSGTNPQQAAKTADCRR